MIFGTILRLSLLVSNKYQNSVSSFSVFSLSDRHVSVLNHVFAREGRDDLPMEDVMTCDQVATINDVLFSGVDRNAP